MASPIEQFEIKPIVSFGKIGGSEIAFTNSGLFMAIAVAIIGLLFVYGTRNRSLVPGRLQALAEMGYEFVASTVKDSAGHDGMKFVPLVFSLFMFVLVCNLLGLIPGAFTVTSHLVVTAALAAIVILTVIIYGIAKHGAHFFGLFVPKGVHPLMLIILVPIEVISFVSRPISLSVRLFANLLAGHIALKIFAGFVATLVFAGGWIVLSPLPLLLTVAIVALEFLVAVLQAYVFAVLTCIYLHDALHPGH
ncbi:ATP synthase F0F1 subunit A [Bosea sp. Root483D1]|uniref:F0F1 ATP synthase subunit A n=1 Tax=Bosea sp. Root483D1 TaxID=1736544 RepID=UPI00070D5825|nr:F0F1 ATP synthase subunit A [Bosea sp. Root483D1]KRE23989.1 ATP synthase F0F1 subunit A [Bosea sp. Root483D1]